ncbi:MAG: hypothetical protein AB1846_00055 [Chloroflexota bacterium]
MGIASFVIGILSSSGVCLSLIPLLNVVNCVSLPFALIGFVLGLVDLLRPNPQNQGRAMAAIGLTLNLLALIVGGIRFLISLFTTGGIV